jgi:hypothetical protein
MSVFGEIKDRIARYIDVNVDLVKVNLIGRTAVLVSYLIFSLIALLIVFCIALFLGLGLTSALMETGMSTVAAYFVTMAIYLVLLIVVILLRKPISRFFADSLVEVLTTYEADDDNDSNSQNTQS